MSVEPLNKKKYVSIKLKINFLVFIIMVSLSVAVSFYLNTKSEKRAYEVAKTYMKTIPSIIDSSINNFMTAGDKTVVKKLITDLSMVENVIGIHIFDPNGDISCNFSNFRIDNPARYLDIIYKNFQKTEVLKEITDDKVKMLSYFKPYENKTECRRCHKSSGDIIGVLNININTSMLVSKLSQDVKIVNIFMLLSSLIIAGIISFVINLFISNPLKKLHEGMNSVAENNLESKIEIKSGDEFEEVATHFNKMVSSLKNANLTIDEMHKNIIHSDRLTTIGQLTASLSHEIKNPLNSIMITADLLLLKCEQFQKNGVKDLSENKIHIENIISDTMRIKDIIDQTLNFSRLNTSQREDILVSDLIDKIKMYVTRFMFDHNNIKFVTTDNTGNEGCMINVNKTNIEQVFINIVKNAIESIPKNKSGEVVFTVTCCTENRMVKFVLRDNGKGISKESLANIFNEFYTTKKNGTGLGLPIAKELVEQHDGTIEINSEENKGTEVIVKLPVIARKYVES